MRGPPTHAETTVSLQAPGHHFGLLTTGSQSHSSAFLPLRPHSAVTVPPWCCSLLLSPYPHYSTPHRYRATVGDVAAAAGVKLSEAEAALQALAYDAQAVLQVWGGGSFR